MRRCASPGCRFVDFHAGAHSYELVGVRDATRHLRIPGTWWRHVTPDDKRRTFDGVVVGQDDPLTYRVYVPHDDQEYQMRADAVRAYAVSSGA